MKNIDQPIFRNQRWHNFFFKNINHINNFKNTRKIHKSYFMVEKNEVGKKKRRKRQ